MFAQWNHQCNNVKQHIARVTESTGTKFYGTDL